MNGIFIIPTGIGAEIGGHAGDGAPAAKLIASLCDRLIVHPNVVNASDINEMTENMLYTEGSILDRFLEGHFCLQESKGNKILLVVNEIKSEIVNAVSAARSVMGANIKILELAKPIKMITYMSGKRATGNLYGVNDAIEQVESHDFDVLVVNTSITTNDEDVKSYLVNDGGVNLWGGVEAKLSKEMSRALDKPVIHAPIEHSEVFKTFNEVVDPRKAAEMVSVCYLHCCLKGAHVAPRIDRTQRGLLCTDIDFMVTPAHVVGPPHRACLDMGVPIIAVKENKTVLNDSMPKEFIVAGNYLEAAGIIASMKAGVTVESVRRPLARTTILD